MRLHGGQSKREFAKGLWGFVTESVGILFNASDSEERKPLDARMLALLIGGFACLVAFSRMLSLGFVGYFTQGVFSSTDEWYLMRTAATIVTLCVLALAGRFRWFSIGGKTLALATALMVAAAIVFAVDSGGAYGPVVAVVAGSTNAVLTFVWFLLLACLSPRTVVQVVLPGLVVSWALVSGVPYLDYALALVVAVACAFASGAAAFMVDSDLRFCVSDGPLSESESSRIPWLTVVTVVVCGLYAMVLYAVADQLTWLYNWSANTAVFALSACAVVVATAAVMVRMDGWMHLVWLPLFALVALAIVCSCLPMRETIQIAAGFILAAVFCAHFLYWMIFPAILSELRVPRVFLAGVLLVFCNGSLASSVGNQLAEVIPRSMQSLGSVAGMMAIVLCAIFAVTFAINRHSAGAAAMWPVVSDEEDAYGVVDEGVYSSAVSDQASMTESVFEISDKLGISDVEMEREAANDVLGAAGDSPNAAGVDQNGPSAQPADQSTEDFGVLAEPNPLDLLKGRLDALSGEFGLTPREKEIAFFTVQGFSCAYIAEKLVVSNSTVRFHQQNLYRKFDVHSRNELIEFVNGPGGADA